MSEQFNSNSKSESDKQIHFLSSKSEKSPQYKWSVESAKFPYCGKNICITKIKTRAKGKIKQRFAKQIKRVSMSIQLAWSVFNGLAPLAPAASRAIGLPYLPSNPVLMQSVSSDALFLKEDIIAKVRKQLPAEFVFSKSEMGAMYDLAFDFHANSLTQHELKARISSLRGGDLDYKDVLVIIFIILIARYTVGSFGFQINPQMGRIVPPHLQWLYGNNNQGQQGYGKGFGPRSVTIVNKATQNAGSDRKNSPGSWDYNYAKIMKELDRQSSEANVYIQVGNESYVLKNRYRESSYELGDKLANKMYDSIRECDTDICDIAQNLGFKADNIKKVKDHVFFNEHNLDRYPNEPVERKRFDPELQ